MTNKRVSKIASFRSLAEHPVARTINVMAQRTTRIVSMIFQMDCQYVYREDNILTLVPINLSFVLPVFLLPFLEPAV